jgi:hypothetical protein
LAASIPSRDQDGVCLLLLVVRANGPPAYAVLGIGRPGVVGVLSGWCRRALWFGGEQAPLLLRVDADLRTPD